MAVLTTKEALRFTVGPTQFVVHCTPVGGKTRYFIDAPDEVKVERVKHVERPPKAPIGARYKH